MWANVTGLVLVYLTLGYWLGDRLADRFPTERSLMASFLGALMIFSVPLTTLGAIAPWAVRLAVREVVEAVGLAPRVSCRAHHVLFEGESPYAPSPPVRVASRGRVGQHAADR